MSERATPPWAWLALSIAVLAMSSGGLWFALLSDVPPVMRACWRLTATALLQLPLFLRESAALPAAAETAALRARWRVHLPVMGVAGFFLAVHFAAWSWSIAHTSLTHSLLLVWTTPLIMVCAMGMRHVASRLLVLVWPPPPLPLLEEPATPAASSASSSKLSAESDGAELMANVERAPVATDDWDVQAPSSTHVASPEFEFPAVLSSLNLAAALEGALRRALAPAVSLPPTALEAFGSALSFSASALLIFSASSAAPSSGLPQEEVGVTVGGDLMAFLGAAAVWIYLEVGGSLRSWLPLFHYVFPVTLASAASAGALSFAFEPSATLSEVGAASLFGFLGSPERFGLVFGAAFCSGMLGHTLVNLSLAHISPLVVAVSGLWEPLLGSLLGYMVGVQGMPGETTLIAGPLLCAGCLLTTLGARDSGFDLRRRICGGPLELR